MLEQIEGSKAVARAVVACRPQVVCAYPITPQTHIVEAIGAELRSERAGGFAFLNVESEFAAMSVCIGASAAGGRAYTATASQGLLYMTEAVYNAAGMGLPIVMTVANRAVGAPINIWNDHSDAMALRDSGWVQLYAADNQQAVDFHPLAFRLAEMLSVPVMVCIDGFSLTHAVERIDIPEQAAVDRFLPPFRPQVRLDPARPLTLGAMVGPEAFTEVRFLAHARFGQVLDVMPGLSDEHAALFGRRHHPFVEEYRTDDADTIVVALGSVNGALQEAVDRAREDGHPAGSVAVSLYRPFPAEALRTALRPARRVVVVDRALPNGSGGFLWADVLPVAPPSAAVHDVVAGLGGRPVTVSSLAGCIRDAAGGRLGELTFLDLDHRLLDPQMRSLELSPRQEAR